MTFRNTAFGGGLLGSLFLASAADAATTFTDRASFDAAIVVQTLEDFEDTNVTDGGVLACPAPADATSNDGVCFDTGDIAPGVTFLDNPGPEVEGLALVGAGFSGNPSKTLVCNTFTDTLVIQFSPAVLALGADFGSYFTEGTVDITLYDDQNAVILATTHNATNAGTFWGYLADVPIVRAEIRSAIDQAEGVDNLAFGFPQECGDGWVTGSEECEPVDWIYDATCDPDCTLPVCGDGFRNAFAGESCDDGGTTPGDGCDDLCGAEILFDQLGSWDLALAYDQDFETAYDDYDSEAADDFVVPAGETWSITTILTAGLQESGGTADSVDVSIHMDASGLPGAVATSLGGGDCQWDAVVPTEVGGSFTITLPTSCSLGQGTYWARVQPNQTIATDGFHYWWFQTSATGNPAAWRNPGGGWGICQTWSPVTACYGDVGPDLAFGVDGELEVCGDGVVQSYLGEQCDEGADNSDTEADACRTTCEDPACGDGVIDTGEGCDDGVDNSDTEPGACRTTCAPANCGDGITDTDEECDDGADNSDTEADACRTTCVEAACGDGVADTGEACDDGVDNSDTEADACRESCEEAGCGDGVTDTGEECDDGNTSSGDGCDSSCMSEGAGGGGTGGSGTGGGSTGGGSTGGGSTGGGSTGGSGTGNTGVGATMPADGGDASDEGSCGCRVPGPAEGGDKAAWLGLGMLGFAALRRRRRSV